MKSLYVNEQGARLVKKGERLEVWVGEVLLQSVRCDELSQVVVMGNAGLTTQAVKALLAAGSDVVFLSRQGSFIGRLSCGLSRQVVVRRAQYRLLDDEANALAVARRFVSGKVTNQRRLLLRQQRKRPDEQVATACTRLRHLLDKIAGAAGLDELRGLEGAAAREYFGVFGKLLRAQDITFVKRVRRPPPDPVNVLLSFGYTLLGNLVQAAVEACGLDPYFGCLHEPRHGRPALVLDLMEEFRPVAVDSAVLEAVNTRAVTARDFLRQSEAEDDVEREWERLAFAEAEREGRQERMPERPIVFQRTGVKKWLAVWQRRLERRALYRPRELRLTLRQVITEQVYRFAEFVAGSREYEPYQAPF